MVKREAQKPVLDQEGAESRVKAVLESMAPLISSETSVSADIKIRKNATPSTYDVSLTSGSSSEPSVKPVDMLPRVRGLSNLGNTCFFNSMLQNLSQTPFLLDVLKESAENDEHFELPGGKLKIGDEEVELPKISGELKEWGSFTRVLAETIEEMQTKSGGVTTPRELLRQFTSKWPQFAGGDQHDAHEALRHLLESVRTEDLRRFQAVILEELGYNKKIDPSSVENDVKAKIKFYGNQAQDRILRPEPVFRGYLVSTLTCQDCNNISPRQETFLDISLPVTMDKPHPPATRRKTSPEPPTGPSKSQLKKEKREMRKAKRNAKNLNRKLGSAGDADGEAKNDSSAMSESDADVEDSITDDTQRDANGNTELKSPQTPEKKDDQPENPFKGEGEGVRGR